MPEPILVAQGLAKNYGRNHAVRGISFSVSRGEIFGLLGPNGAGKTTTLSMLSCLFRPTSGDAEIGGHSITKDPMAVKRLIGVVPQELALYESLSACQNLKFWGRMYGLGGQALNRRITEVLRQVSLADHAKEPVAHYSGGMKRRLNIAVGLLHQPQIVFMDEPTVGIDPQSRRSILDMVKALRARGTTVLYTTHYMEEASELSDRVGIIDHGQLIALGTQKELTKLVGEQDTLRLHLGEEHSGESVASLFQAVGNISFTTVDDHEVALTVPEAAAALPSVFAVATKAGIRIRSVEIDEPNLESVFLHLTGRALRD